MENSSNNRRTLQIEICRAQLLGAAIGIGILGFIVALPLFYFKSGMRDWGKLLGLSAAVGVFTGAIARTRSGGKQKRVIVNEEGLTIENEKNRTVLPWMEVEQVNHWVHGDHYWEFVSAHHSRPTVLKGFGFSKQQCTQLSETIQTHKRLVEEQVGVKRALEDAFVH